jgi:MscS family membrane protein
MVAGTYFYVPLVQEQVFVLGQFSTLIDIVAPLLGYLGTAWLAWHIIFVLTEFAIRNPRIPTDSLDANLMRLAARVLGIGAVVFCLVKAAEGFGVPVLGIAAGLGAGGLAFGLAAQGTIENLIGALTIYFDRPLNVGDYCRVAGVEGTVEKIGLRSSAIRTLDRSLVTLPNSVIVKAEIQNFSRRDTFLFRHTFRLPLALEPGRLNEISGKVLAVLSHSDLVDRNGPIPPRAPVVAIGQWSIEMDVLAYLAAIDYGAFLTMQDQLIAQLRNAIAELGIEIAMPTSVTRLVR